MSTAQIQRRLINDIALLQALLVQVTNDENTDPIDIDLEYVLEQSAQCKKIVCRDMRWINLKLLAINKKKQVLEQVSMSMYV